MTGFFTPANAAIPPASVDAMLAAYEELVRTHFGIDPEDPTGSGIGYVIVSKMGDLFEQKGDRIAGVERVLDDRERTGPDGTRRREPGQIMEVPNQPIGNSVQILTLWSAFFPARPGHWGGWELETYPVITEIHFTDADRTKAAARVTIGYSGGTVELEKEGGVWTARRLTNSWIT